MSKKSNDQNIVPESKVLTTSVSRTVAKFAFGFAAIGLAIGILVMVFLNLGLHEKISTMVGQLAAEEIVAHTASDEVVTASEGDKTIGVKDLGVSFGDYAMMYDGTEYELLAQNTSALPEGVTVTYVNNKHKDVGVYKAVAVFSGAGYVTEVLEAELKIVKADIKNVTFSDILVEYKEGVEHELTVEGEIPEGVEVQYSLNKVTEAGVYHATAVLYGQNYNNLVLSATITVVDLTKLVSYDNVDEEKNAILFTYNKGEHTVELNTSAVLPEILENRNFKIEYDVNTFVNAGTYTVVATVSADGFTTFTVPVTVIVEQGDIENVHGFTANTGSTSYDGENKEISYKFSDEEIDHIGVDVKYYLVDAQTGEKTGDPLTADEVRDPKTYKVVITLTDSTGNCAEKVIERDFVINKRNVSMFYDIEDGEAKYSTETVAQEDGSYAKVGKVHKLTMTFDATRLYSTITNQPIIVRFTYGETTVIVAFTFEKEVLVDQDGNEILTDKDIVVSTYELDGVTYREEHDFNNVEFIIPIEFVDQGTYVMDVVVEGNDYDADTTMRPKMVINYASLSGITVSNSQLVFVDGNLHAPKYTSKTQGVTVEMYDKNGNLVEGFKYFGFHDVKMVFTSGNYQTTKNVRFILMFNPVIALIGLLIGALIGLFVGFITSLVWTNKEKSSRTHFRAPSTIVANARGGIICESYAKCENSGCSGRLYLSSKSIEFYADDYKALKDNFLIDIDDVRNVDAIAPNKIQVYAKKEVYTFTVPDGTAGEWAHEIVRA